MSAAARARRAADEVRARHAFGHARPRRRLPRQLPPIHLERSYARQIVDLVVPHARAIVSRLVERVRPLVIAHASARRHDVDEASAAREAIGAARREASINVAGVDRLVRDQVPLVSQYNREQLGRQVRAGLGLNESIPFRDSKLGAIADGWAVQNAELITSITPQVVERVAQAVARGMSDGTMWEDLADELQGIGFGEVRAKIIARDQIGKLNGQINASRQEELGISKFVWRSVGDERVRDLHQEIDGQDFEYPAGHPTEGLPGEPVLCRCYAEPVFDPITDDLDGEVEDDADEG